MVLDFGVSLPLGPPQYVADGGQETVPGPPRSPRSLPFDLEVSERLKWMENTPGDQMDCLSACFLFL